MNHCSSPLELLEIIMRMVIKHYFKKYSISLFQLTTETPGTSSTPKDEKITDKKESKTADDVPNPEKQKEDSIPSRRKSSEKTYREKEEIKETTEEKDETVAKDEEVKDPLAENSDTDAPKASNEIREDSTETAKESSEPSEENDKILIDVKDNIDTEKKAEEVESANSSVEIVDNTKVSSPNTSVEIIEEREDEVDEENMLDPTDGTLKIGGKIVEISPPSPPNPPTPMEPCDKNSLNELMLSNNMEITICKAPAEIGARRGSSNSTGSGKAAPGNDASSDLTGGHSGSASRKVAPSDVLSNAAIVASSVERASILPLLSAEGSVKGVSEAELMLASVSDGEITITKSLADGKTPPVESSGKSR